MRKVIIILLLLYEGGICMAQNDTSDYPRIRKEVDSICDILIGGSKILSQCNKVLKEGLRTTGEMDTSILRAKRQILVIVIEENKKLIPLFEKLKDRESLEKVKGVAETLNIILRNITESLKKVSPQNKIL